MKCPYCVSDISDEASVCVHCGRDIYLFKPLLAKIDALEQQVAEMPPLLARIENLETQLSLGGASQAGDTGDQQGLAPSLPARLLRWTLCWLLPLALLLAAHGLIILVYDLNTLYLRLVSLVIPLPFGFLLMFRHRHSLLATLAGAFAMALLAVLGMSWMTAQVDHVPVLPQDAREWKEVLEYAASIGFSFTTGVILGSMLRLRRQLKENAARSSATLRFAKTLGKGKENAVKAQEIADKLNNMIGTITTIGTTVISVYTGLKGVLGD